VIGAQSHQDCGDCKARPKLLASGSVRLYPMFPLVVRERKPAPVAQLDRALPSEGRGREFESRRVRHRLIPQAQSYALGSLFR
jgi:hypothetical protein